MPWLKEHAHFAQTGAGSFVLTYQGLLRLDETVPREVVYPVMRALTDGQSFQDACAELPAEQQAPARDLLAILAHHGLMVATRTARSWGLAPLSGRHVSDQPLAICGDEALATGLAAALRQCGLNARAVASADASATAEATGLAMQMPGVAAPGSTLLCHVAENDDGLCWSFAGARGQAPVAPAHSAVRRAASLGAAAPSGGRGAPIPDATVATIAAHQIARGMLCTCPARTPAGKVTFLDRRTLRTTACSVAAHPYDLPAKQQTHEESRRDHEELRDGPPLRRSELAQRWQGLSHERFGVFAGPDDAQLRQLPLNVTVVRLSDPCGLLPAPAAVAGAGIDAEGAWERAIIRALAAYGSMVVDPRLLVDSNGTFLGPREGGATALLRSVRDGSVDAFVRVSDLTDGRERLLPAQQAFPVLGNLRASPVPCGAAAGLHWRQALTHGLLQHCIRLTIRDSPPQARKPSALAAAQFDHDPGVRYLAAMVKAAGIDLTLRDITGAAGVPVVACATASGDTVYGGGMDQVEAVREALTATLLRYQRRCDPVLRAATATPPSTAWTNPASAVPGPDLLIHALTSLGYTPSVFALDHDQAVREVFPCILRVTVQGRSDVAGI
jgi:hypothetical protein